MADPIDRDALVLENLHLAQWFARRAWRRLRLDEPGRGAPEQLDDLVQEMRLALMTAAEQYDPARGAFSTFAHWKMRGRLSRVLARWAHLPAPHFDPDFFDRLPDPSPSAESVAESAESLAWTEEALRFLPPREAELVRRTMLGDEAQAALAEEWGVSKQRVSQIAEQALARLRRRFAEV